MGYHAKNTGDQKPAQRHDNNERTGNESDIVSFWLLLLFIAVFFGIAAEEARRPMFSATTAAQTPFHSSSVDIRTNTARRLDLEPKHSVDNRAVPATGK